MQVSGSGRGRMPGHTQRAGEAATVRPGTRCIAAIIMPPRAVALRCAAAAARHCAASVVVVREKMTPSVVAAAAAQIIVYRKGGRVAPPPSERALDYVVALSRLRADQPTDIHHRLRISDIAIRRHSAIPPTCHPYASRGRYVHGSRIR